MIKRVFLTIIYVTLAFGRKENFFITQTTFLINLYFHFISKMKQLKYLFDNLQNYLLTQIMYFTKQFGD